MSKNLSLDKFVCASLPLTSIILELVEQNGPEIFLVHVCQKGMCQKIPQRGVGRAGAGTKAQITGK